MALVNINEASYKTFKKFLGENDINSNNIRIYVSGMGCSGPTFSITVGDPMIEDVSEVVGDIVFIMDDLVVKKFGGVTIECFSSDDAINYIIKPNIKTESSSCGGGCSNCN